MASKEIGATVAKDVLDLVRLRNEIANDKTVGDYLIQKIFKPDAKCHWREIIKKPLTKS